MKIIRRAELYEEVRRGYGVCWLDASRCQVVTAPIPLNLAMRLSRGCWLFLIRPFWSLDVLFREVDRASEMRALRIENERLRLQMRVRSLQDQNKGGGGG